MIYSLVIFLGLIAVISSLRTRLVYELSGISLLLFGSTTFGIKLYSLIVLPGTIIHELSHWLVAEILRVRTGEITIFPDTDEVEGESRRLGSVATERTDPFRGFLIGIAPFGTGLLILIILGRLLADGWGIYLWWQIAVIIYGIIVIGNSMMISSADRKTWPFILILLSTLGFLAFKYYPGMITWLYPIILNSLSPLNIVLGVTAGLNLVMIGGSYGLRRLIEKMTKKRIFKK